MIYWDLFFGFLRVGCFSFGGAYGAIPLIRDVVISYGWITDESLTYMIAVSESTPGPIMVNLATYIGSSQAGFAGAMLATLAVVLPSFFIILLIMAVLKALIKNSYVQALLRGLKPCVIGMVLATGVYMVVSNVIILERNHTFCIPSAAITLILAAVMYLTAKILKKKMSPIMLIVLSAALGVLFYGG